MLGRYLTSKGEQLINKIGISLNSNGYMYPQSWLMKYARGNDNKFQS